MSMAEDWRAWAGRVCGVRRGVTAFVCVALGVLIGRWMWESGAVDGGLVIGVVLVTLGLLAVVLARGAWGREVAAGGLIVAAVGVGCSAWWMRIAQRDADDLNVVAARLGLLDAEGDGILVRLRGRAVTDVSISERERAWGDAPFGGGVSLRFEMSIASVGPVGTGEAEWQPASGRVSVAVAAEDSQGVKNVVRAGRAVEITGLLSVERSATNPGMRQATVQRLMDDRVGSVLVEHGGLIVEPTAEQPGAVRGWWWAAVGGLRVATERAMERGDRPRAVIDERTREARAMVSAMLTGRVDEGLTRVSEEFTRLGLLHALSISGFHMAVLAGAVLMVVRCFGELGRWELAIACGVIGVYVLVVPSGPPVVRSAVMLWAWMGALAAGRRLDAVNVLGWVGAGMLVVRPVDLWDVGFQLSFGVTGALVWLVPRVEGVVLRPTVRGVRLSTAERMISGVRRGVVRALVVSVVAWVVSVPVIAYQTGVVSPLGVLAGLVGLPMISVTLVAGYAALAVGLVGEAVGVGGVGVWAWGVVDALGVVSLKLTAWIESLGGSHAGWWVPGVSGAWAAVTTVLLVTALGFPVLRSVWLTRAVRVGLVVCAAWGAIGMMMAARSAGLDDDVVARVDRLEVGKGRCAMVRGQRAMVIIDAGSTSSKRSVGMGRMVSDASRALGVWRCSALVLTRASADRAGGALGVVDRLGVREVIIGEAFARVAEQRPGSSAAELLRQLEGRSVNVRVARAGDRLELDDGLALVFEDGEGDGRRGDELGVRVESRGARVEPIERLLAESGARVRSAQAAELKRSGAVRLGAWDGWVFRWTIDQ